MIAHFKVICWLMIFALGLCSCAPKLTTVTTPKDFPMTATARASKIPLRAALYIKPIYQNLTPPGEKTIQMGEAFLGGSERMLRNIFQEVTVIDNTDKKGYDVMVIPENIMWGRGTVRTPLVRSWYQMDITWNVLSPEGKVIYISTVRSELIRALPAGTKSQIINKLATAFVLSLDDQLLRAQDDLYSNKWWAKQWWKES